MKILINNMSHSNTNRSTVKYHNFIKCAVILSVYFSSIPMQSQTLRDSLLTHKTVYGQDGKLLPWYKPESPGAAYDKVIDLAAGFLKNDCPAEPTSGLPLYMVHTWFSTPREVGQEIFDKGLSGSDDGHTPACTYANFVKSLVTGYYVYTGDAAYIALVRRCLDQLIEHGTTPDDESWKWRGCPYASANPRSPEYSGATHWGVGGRNDGPYVIEPDKVGEMGLQYLRFYQVVEEEKYLEAAVKCADALAANVREVYTSSKWDYVYEDHELYSPWPFRVSAENGQVHEHYTANVVEAVKLFEELIRLKDRLGIDQEKIDKYQKVRDYVWWWLFSKEGPMRSFAWKGYFEDIPNDKYNKNRVQNIPMETARHIIENPECDPNYRIHVPALIYWVATAFEIEDMDAIREQFWCYEGMGSHTARYASICALWYEHTGDEWFKKQAYRFFNWATYVCDENGHVMVGPGFYQYWFTDGYGDYIRHFIEGMAAIPEWAPADEDHVLRSSSVIQSIEYSDLSLKFRTYDDQSDLVVRLNTKPKSISVEGIKLGRSKVKQANSWYWKDIKAGGGVLYLNYSIGQNVVINK
jgi:hypothetical protein